MLIYRRKQMKKVLALVVAVLLTAAVFVGCGPSNDKPDQEPSVQPSEAASVEPPAEATPETTFEIAMITDKGDIDDKSFNQGTWEGILEYAEANGKTHLYYKPAEVTTDAYIAAIDLAVKGGAKIIITPGFLFEPAIYVAQDTYPDIKFVLIDGDPNDGDWNPGPPKYKRNDNVYSIFFAEQQAGFLAGYASVKDGYRKLGFMGGMAVPAVVRFGYGYVQGAEVAAKELGLKKGDVQMMYNYTGGFEATPEVQTLAASWYTSGTEVIFGCGGKVGNSVFAAADANNGKGIGVDSDQSSLSPSVITSAMKGVGNAAKASLTDYYAGTFKGGVSEYLDITIDMIGLPYANSKFNTFSQADYDAIYDRLVKDTDGIRTSLWNDTTTPEVTGLPVEIVAVTLVK